VSEQLVDELRKKKVQLECDLSMLIAEKVKTFADETGFVPYLSVHVYSDTINAIGYPPKELFRNVKVEADISI
jgi:hypothetical protein